MRQHPKPVENYTNPFLVAAAVVLFNLLVATWAMFGYPVALFVAVVVLLAITRIPHEADDYRPAQTRAAASKAPPP